MTEHYDSLSPFWKSILYMSGFVKVERPFWKHLLPHVVLFSLSVIMLKTIRMKLAKDEIRLFTSKELNDPETFR